jgi:cytochrome c553
MGWCVGTLRGTASGVIRRAGASLGRWRTRHDACSPPGSMRRARVLVLAAVLGCAEEEPRLGNPSGMRGKNVPGVPGTVDTTPGADDPFFPRDQSDPPAPSLSAKAGHAAADPPQVEPTPTLACHACHGAGTTKEWAFGGYVKKRNGDEPAGGAVVVVLSGGERFATRADADGFFWFSGPVGSIVAGSQTAVKDPEGKAVMLGPIANGNCSASGCHDANRPIFVPE